jgi:membrane-associated protease RseP (regulator of RpoE activity)
VVELVAVLATLALIALRELVRHVVWKTTKQLALAVIAANVASYVFAAAVAFGMFALHGTTIGYRTTVDEVMPGYDAAGKLQAGDAILAVDHEPLDDFSLPQRVARKNGEAVTLTIERAGATSEVTITPTRSTEGGTPQWLLGIKRRPEPIQSRDVGAALGNAAVFPVTQVRMLARQVSELFAGSDHADAGGPMRIVDEFRVQRSFLVLMGQRLMQFAVFAMLLMFVTDIIRVIRLARLART